MKSKPIWKIIAVLAIPLALMARRMAHQQTVRRRAPRGSGCHW